MQWNYFPAYFASLLIICLSTAPPLHAETLHGKVIGITDGDTLTLLVEERQYKIRLAEIDTPERGQPYASRAREVLSDLAFNKSITAVVQDIDRYGRYVALLYHGEIDINAEMVKRGAAWVYREYSTIKDYYDYENQAKAGRLGIWSLPESSRIPPWEWRRNGNQPAIDNENSIQPNTTTDCGTKRYCREMTSCQEARFYLESCGVRTLDGDKDGVPCEAICR